MAFLEVNNLHKSFGDVNVLKGISFKIEKGEVLSIIGSSGNGKTTLIRCLNFLEIPNAGTIVLNGEQIFPIVKNVKTDKTIGMVFQNFNLFPQYSALKNVSLPLDLKIDRDVEQSILDLEKRLSLLKKDIRREKRKKSYFWQVRENFYLLIRSQESFKNFKPTLNEKKAEIKANLANENYLKEIESKISSLQEEINLCKQKINSLNPTYIKECKYANLQKANELLERVGLGEKKQNYPCELSGGQQQRVAIARALALEPDILCFDEPTSALDPELTGEVLKVIRQLRDEGHTMIIITHEMEFARNVSDKIIFMADGVIEEMGPPEQVIDNPISEKTKSFLQKSLEKI